MTVASLPGPSNPLDVNILPAVALPTQYIITGIQINGTKLFADPSTPLPGMTITLLDIIFVGAPITVREFPFNMRTEFERMRYFVLCSETGLNIPVQSLDMVSTDFSTGAGQALPPWSVVTANITYALVTL